MLCGTAQQRTKLYHTITILHSTQDPLATARSIELPPLFEVDLTWGYRVPYSPVCAVICGVLQVPPQTVVLLYSTTRQTTIIVLVYPCPLQP